MLNLEVHFCRFLLRSKSYAETSPTSVYRSTRQRIRLVVERRRSVDGIQQCGHERAAWLYEIGRRLGKDEGKAEERMRKFPPFPKLDEELVTELVMAWPDQNENFGDPMIEFPQGSRAIRHLQRKPGHSRLLIATFDLERSDDALIQRFKDFLAVERERTGIEHKARSIKGRRNRPISWRYVEMLDLKKHYAAHPKAKKWLDVDNSALAKLRKLWTTEREKAGILVRDF